MPYQITENEDKYLENLGYISACIDEAPCTNFAIIGDWNANLGSTGTNMFKRHMIEFCDNNGLSISSMLLLPNNSYTHIYTRENATFYSWLDHIVCSKDMHNAINSIEVLYDISDEDHLPVRFTVNVSNMPTLTNATNDYTPKINWNDIPDNKLAEYHIATSKHLSNVTIPVEALCCSNTKCYDVSHRKYLETMYDDITNSLCCSSKQIIKSNKNKNHFHKPGWTDYVSDLYNFSRETYKIWTDKGKPRQGPIYNIYSQSE